MDGGMNGFCHLLTTVCYLSACFALLSHCVCACNVCLYSCVSMYVCVSFQHSKGHALCGYGSD